MARTTVAWFFALAFAGTWALQFTFIALGSPWESPLGLGMLTLAGVMPSLVAYALARREGRAAVSGLWGPPGRAGVGVLALAVLVPVLAKLMVAVVLVVLGMPVPGVGISIFVLGAVL